MPSGKDRLEIIILAALFTEENAAAFITAGTSGSSRGRDEYRTTHVLITVLPSASAIAELWTPPDRASPGWEAGADFGLVPFASNLYPDALGRSLEDAVRQLLGIPPRQDRVTSGAKAARK